MHETVLVIDFGAQYSEVIARRIRENNVYCEVLPWTTSTTFIQGKNPIGIVLSGGPSSVYLENSPKVDPAIFELGIPVLGICYGMQLMVTLLGGKVTPAQDDKGREYGKAVAHFDTHCPIFKRLPNRSVAWMSHGDHVEKIPSGFKVSATTKNCEYAAIYNEEKNFYGVQFHPEVEHTQCGKEMIKAFLERVCHAKGDWSMKDYYKQAIEEIKKEVGDKKVLLALSGGVDSSVAAVLLSHAIGKNLTCVYVDHGFMRKNETEEIVERFSKYDLNFIKVDARKDFMSALKGVKEPEKKRHIIGKTFIDVFSKVANELKGIDYLAQGTIYPDVIESGSINGNTIKSHHNVGGLPENLPFKKIIEPLSKLFKDEVRELGLEMGIDEALVFRQPFPGPGLAVRIIGDITDEKLEILKEADYIFREVIAKNKYQRKISQYFAVLTNMQSVGVMGDKRTYQYAIALRAVSTDDFMTANYVRLPYRVLDEASRRIVNEVKGVNRVVYDITSKPPATIEYE